MKRIRIVTLLTAVFVICIFAVFNFNMEKNNEDRKVVRVGYIYNGDESAPYTNNFIKAQKEVETVYGDRVENVVMSNISDEKGEMALEELVSAGCDIIFTTSYGYGESAKKFAEKFPDIQFCEATCDNANTDPVLPNYHTFMGEIYEGRYVAGIVAGMKIKEMIDNGTITEDEAVIGYVGAYPYAEVISGYTAFLLGARKIAPTTTMKVRYTNTWTSYTLEKKLAEELIDEGCVIISQHSDTIGPAVACEETYSGKVVYHVGYNQSMIDVAPTTSLVSTRINWSYYMVEAVGAVLDNKKIEDNINGHVHGNDVGAGFENDWVQIMDINNLIAADGTSDAVNEAIEALTKGTVEVFKGDYIGVDPFDESDTYDLNKGYKENENASAPSFHYILKDVITVEEN